MKNLNLEEISKCNLLIYTLTIIDWVAERHLALKASSNSSERQFLKYLVESEAIPAVNQNGY